jgi:hypothetical protein
VKLKGREVIASINAIRALDHTPQNPVSLDGLTTLALTRTLNRLEVVEKEIQSSGKKLAESCGCVLKNANGRQYYIATKEKPDAVDKYTVEFEKVLEYEFDVVTTQIKWESLKPDENNLPVSALSALAWMITFPEEKKA